jgi:hypothetical protein
MSQLERENAQLRKEKEMLEALVEVLCKQNLQLNTVLTKLGEKERKRGMDRAKRILLSIANAQDQHYAVVQTLEEQAVADWNDFCDEIETDRTTLVCEKLEDIKERIIQENFNNVENLVIGIEM